MGLWGFRAEALGFGLCRDGGGEGTWRQRGVAGTADGLQANNNGLQQK